MGKKPLKLLLRSKKTCTSEIEKSNRVKKIACTLRLCTNACPLRYKPNPGYFDTKNISRPVSPTGTKRNRMVTTDHENFRCLLNSRKRSPSRGRPVPSRMQGPHPSLVHSGLPLLKLSVRLEIPLGLIKQTSALALCVLKSSPAQEVSFLLSSLTLFSRDAVARQGSKFSEGTGQRETPCTRPALILS